jgi:hypothetical protein
MLDITRDPEFETNPKA